MDLLKTPNLGKKSLNEIEAKVNIAFKAGSLSKAEFTGWIADRMNLNVEKRLLQLDLGMILEPFVNRPGKQWWAGEHVGKHLHAATYAWRFTGDDRLKARMDATVNKLIATQLPNGYLGTYKESDQFGQGDGIGWDGPVWDVWTHKYNLIGLLTYYQATDHQPALDACKRAADLMYENFVVKETTFSQRARRGIASVPPMDANSQDVSVLIGSEDISKLDKYAEDDPRVLSLNGAFNVGKRGIVELVEVFKNEIEFLHTIITATQEKRVPSPGKHDMIYFDGVILAHCNEAEWNKFQSEHTNEAILDRVVKVNVPYVLELDQEIKIYAPLIAVSYTHLTLPTICSV